MKALKIIVAVVVVVIVGVVVTLLTFDVDQYKGTIEAQAKAATGREVTIGDIDLAVSLTPAIILTDVKVANAAWGSRPEMVILPRIEVHTELVPLLFGAINLTKITAENPDILLEIDKKGVGNWEFAVASDGTSSTPLNVSDVSVSGLKLGYRDAQSGGEADVAAKAIAVAITGALQDMNISTLQTSGVTVAYKTAGAPLSIIVDQMSFDNAGKIDLTGNLSGQALKVNGTLAPLGVLVAKNEPFPAKVEIEGLGVRATSDVVIEMVNGRPLAKGTLIIPEVDLSKFASAPAASDGRLFSADPLPWDMILGTDADLKISIAKLITSSGQTLTDVLIPVKASGGRLTAAPIALAIAGGTISGDVTLNANDTSVAVKAQGKGFTAEALAKMFGKDDVIAQGPIDLSVNVRGAGLSVRDVMASLDGAIIVGMGQSRIRNEALNVPGAGVLLQVLNIANPFAQNDAYTSARCAVINFQINDGVAHANQSIALVTDKMSLTSTGQADLRSEQLAFNVRAQAATGVAGGLGQLAQAVQITGSLASPSVTIDQAGLVESVAGLGAALSRGGGGLGELGALLGISPKPGAAAPAAPPSGDLCARARAWRRG